MKDFLKNNPQPLFLFVFAFILYANTISNDYSFDDEYVAINHKLTSKGISGIYDIFTSPYVENNFTAHGYRPITLTTFALEHQFFDGNPHVSHFINTILYGICIAVLFIVLRKLFYEYSIWFSLVVVMVFAAHPLHTEVVASIKNRDEILSMLFAFLSILYLLKYYDTSKIVTLALSSILFICALFSKESAMIYLTVFPMVGYFYLKENYGRIWRPIAFQTIAFFGVLSILFMIFPEFNAREIEFHENPSITLEGYWSKIPYGFYIYLMYLKNMFFPYELSFYYGYDEFPLTQWGDILSLISLVFHIGLAVWAIKMFKKKHMASFAICFYAMAISPMNNITTPTPGIMADRLTFTPSLGFCILLIFIVAQLLKIDLKDQQLKSPTSFNAIFIAITLLFSIKTISRNKDWKDKFTIITTDIEKVNRSTKAHVAAASVHMDRIGRSKDQQEANGHYQKAEKHAKTAIDIYPEMILAHDLLGLLYYRGKRYKDAEKHLLNAISIDSTYTNAISNLAKTKYMKKQLKESIRLYERVILLDPTNVDAIANSSLSYYNMGNMQKAVELNLQAIEIEPSYADSYLYLSSMYFEKGQPEKAVSIAEKGLENSPKSIALCQNLVNYYNRSGNQTKYQFYYRKLTELQKRNK